jgi:hypothetical protein
MHAQTESLKLLNKEQIFDEKARKWRQFNNKKYS